MKAKTKKRVAKILLVLLHVLSIFSLLYFTFGIFKSKSIGNLLEVYIPSKYIISFLIFIFFTTLLLLLNMLKINKKRILVGILSVVLILTSVSIIFGTSYMMKIEKSLQNAASTLSDEISVVFIAKEDSDVEKLDDVKVGMLNNTASQEGYIVPNEYLKTKNEIEIETTKSTWHDLMLSLEEDEVDVIALPASYKTMFEEDEIFIRNKDNFVVIDEYTVTIEKEGKTIEDASKPFNILLAGTDSSLNGTTSGYLFDVVIIATIDPSTGTAVLTSVPRDSTLYSPCIGGVDKITHNGSYGIECLASTLEGAFNTTIDYYMIIGFEGIIDIVEYLGGVYITNPYGDIVVQDSKRRMDTINIPAGRNLLNGEQTLAFARNRKATTSGVEIDANIRSSNHVIVLKAMLERIKEVGITSNLNELIDVVAKSTITDFPINDLASISQIATQLLQNDVSIKNITLEGTGVNFSSPAAGGMELYGYLPYKESVDYITKYIDMVYNQKFVFMDSSTNLSTGSPKVEYSGDTTYGGGNYYVPAYEEPAPTAPVAPTTPDPGTGTGGGGTDPGTGTGGGGTDPGTGGGGTDPGTGGGDTGTGGGDTGTGGGTGG